MLGVNGTPAVKSRACRHQLTKEINMRKLRAMTYKEFCDKFDDSCRNCPFCDEACGLKGDMPCKPNGKYIFVEIKE